MPGSPSKHFNWREIADLPEDLDPLRDRELESLCEVWLAEKKQFADEKRLSDFNAELAREWAIETGIVEGVYTLDRGTTQTLIERGIDSAHIAHDATNRDPELVARIIQAHADVLEGLFAFVRSERTLSTSYIKELHAALLRNIETVVVFDQFGRAFETALEKGAYKSMPNNPSRADGTVHEYCPPEHVASEMDRLIEFHQRHERLGFLPHIEAAWLHHAFTQIHPFQDGNGRVARAIASLVFIKSGYFPLVISRDAKEKYIGALESADQGDLSQLVRLFAQVQKRQLTKAIGRAVDVRPFASLDEALAATRDMLVDLGRIIPKKYLAAKAHAARLANIALSRLNVVTSRLRDEITVVDSTFAFSVGALGGAPANEIKGLAEKLGYDPNLNAHHHSVVATLKAGDVTSRIVISFQGVGAAFRGLLVAVAYVQVGDGAPVPICDDVFRISYQESEKEISGRFEKWLDASLIEGLAEWRRTLV